MDSSSRGAGLTKFFPPRALEREFDHATGFRGSHSIVGEGGADPDLVEERREPRPGHPGVSDC